MRTIEHTTRTRDRIIRYLMARDQTATSQAREEIFIEWDRLSDAELDAALRYAQDRRLREIAQSVDGGTHAGH